MNNYTDFLVAAAGDNRTEEDKALNILFRAEVLFYRTMLPCICVIGLCGNSMAVLLIRTNFALKRLPSNVYLSALSVSSSLFLATVLLMWMESVSSLRIYHGNWWGCKTLTFLAHFCDFSCIWLILSVCTDRMFLLYWPKWRKKVWNLKAAYLCTATILLIGLLLNLWCLPVANVVHGEKGKSHCTFLEEDMHYYLIFHTFDTVISIGIPSALICLVNTLAVVKYRRYRRFQSMTPTVRFRNSFNCSAENNLMVPENNAGRTSFMTTVVTSANNRRQGDPKRPLRPADLQLTRTVLILTTTFLAMNTPSYILRVIYCFVESQLFSDLVEEGLQLIAYALYYGHFAVLFFLYIFWSPQLKKELKPTALKLLECYCFKTVPDFGYEDSAEQRRRQHLGSS